MKKNFKRTLAKVMAVALTVSMVGVASDDVDAAKKIKLSKKTVSVAKGKTKKVTIKNVKAKKVKKLTVKSKNKKIATVKKAGKTAFKVTGKKAGKSTKVTVKVTVKGKKKATKLTLKVKVTKAKKASKSKTTAAPSASATPAASAAASKAPASNAPAPTAPAPEKSYDPEKADLNVALTAEKATTFSTDGEYGQVKFNEDGTVSFSSQPTAMAKDDAGNVTDKVKDVSVYNNGLAFFLGDTAEDQVDVSDYQYVSLRVKTEAEVKLMTWAGGDDANSFWDKSDTWGNTTKVVENADGSKTIVYEVKTAYGKKANKAKAIGLTLKSDDTAKGDDSDPGVAREATLYSITFSNKIPEAVKPAEPTATPVIETVALDLTATSKTMKSDVTPADGVFPYTKQYQSVFFDLPEDINLAQVTKAVIKADVPNQLSFTLWNNTLDQKADKWWEKKSFTAFVTYPFYGGSCTARDEKGGFGGDKGEETMTYDIAPNWTVAGNGGYFSIGSNQKVEEGDVYKILSVELVIDHSKAKIDSVVEPEVTPAPTASASAAPVVTAEPETKAPETSAAPTTPVTPGVNTPNNETPKLEFTAPETASVDTGATVSFKVTNDTAAVETAIWEVSEGAKVDVDKKDCTKATITSEKEGVVTVTVAITLANGKKATKTTEIKFVKDAAIEPVKPEKPKVETDLVINKAYTAKVGAKQFSSAGVVDISAELPADFDITKYSSIKVVGDVEKLDGSTIDPFWGIAQIGVTSDPNNWGKKDHHVVKDVFQNFAANKENKTATLNIKSDIKSEDVKKIAVYAQNAVNAEEHPELADGFNFKITSITFVAKK